MQQKLVLFLTLILTFSLKIANIFLSQDLFWHQGVLAAPSSNSSIEIEESMMPSFPAEIALSKAQKKSIFQLNMVLSQNIREILTSEQLQQFQTSLANGSNLMSALTSLSISDEQRKSLQITLKEFQHQMNQVFTPEQLKYLRQQNMDRHP